MLVKYFSIQGSKAPTIPYGFSFTERYFNKIIGQIKINYIDRSVLHAAYCATLFKYLGLFNKVFDFINYQKVYTP